MLGAAALVADLNDALVFARCLDHLAPLENAVGSRFLDVNILACLAGPNRRQRVPVIRGRDGYGINAVVFEHLAQVLVLGGLALLVLERLLGGSFGDGLVDVDNGGDFGAFVARELADVGFPAPANADAGDLDPLVCPHDLGVGNGG